METNFFNTPLTIGHKTVFICSPNGNISIKITPINISRAEYYRAAIIQQFERQDQRP